jgi:LacI family transcriptional regulator
VHLSPHALGPADVGIDNEAGMASMIAALVELGHREIAFLAGPSTLFVARARLTGYRRGLSEAGLTFDQRLVIHTSFDREGGVLGVDTLLGGEAGFTAIACANDPLAMGALARAAELGVDVPGQLSVAGFDDVPVASITSPSLSTVRLPLREMGRRGFAEAARVLNGEPLEQAVLPTELAMRTSTGAPAALPLADAGVAAGHGEAGVGA